MRQITIKGKAYDLAPLDLKQIREIAATTKVHLMRLKDGDIQNDAFIGAVAVAALKGQLTIAEVDSGLDTDGIGEILAFVVEEQERMIAPVNAVTAAKKATDPLPNSSPAQQ